MVHLDTRVRCAEKNVVYEPLVFTTQGGIEKHAEAVLSQIAAAVAHAEGADTAVIKADMLEEISMSIARSVANAVIRRSKRTPCGYEPAGVGRLRVEMDGLEDEW